jgi:hypothetical protein
VEDFFAGVRQQHGRLDTLACAVWGGNERYLDPVWTEPFWKQPMGIWDEFLDACPLAFGSPPTRPHASWPSAMPTCSPNRGLVFVADLAQQFGCTDVDGTRVGNFYRLVRSE